MTADKLKNCPFCGSDRVTTFGPYGWYYQWGISHSCKSFYNGSQAMFQGFRSEADAIAAWNTRQNTIPDTHDERERIIAWLRDQPKLVPISAAHAGANTPQRLADAIARGDHLTQPTEDKSDATG